MTKAERKLLLNVAHILRSAVYDGLTGKTADLNRLDADIKAVELEPYELSMKTTKQLERYDPPVGAHALAIKLIRQIEEEEKEKQ